MMRRPRTKTRRPKELGQKRREPPKENETQAAAETTEVKEGKEEKQWRRRPAGRQQARRQGRWCGKDGSKRVKTPKAEPEFY